MTHNVCLKPIFPHLQDTYLSTFPFITFQLLFHFIIDKNHILLNSEFTFRVNKG